MARPWSPSWSRLELALKRWRRTPEKSSAPAHEEGARRGSYPRRLLAACPTTAAFSVTADEPDAESAVNAGRKLKGSLQNLLHVYCRRRRVVHDLINS